MDALSPVPSTIEITSEIAKTRTPSATARAERRDAGQVADDDSQIEISHAELIVSLQECSFAPARTRQRRRILAVPVAILESLRHIPVRSREFRKTSVMICLSVPDR